MDKTTAAVNTHGYAINGRDIDREYVLSVIKSRAKDELHKLVKSAYMKKTKYSRAEERREKDDVLSVVGPLRAVIPHLSSSKSLNLEVGVLLPVMLG